MEAPCRNKSGYAPLVLVIGIILFFSVPASAQISKDSFIRDISASHYGRIADTAQRKTPDLLINTHDVTGKVGAALPLEIELVRVRPVEVETIRLFGLPRGMTISDATNTFSPSRDSDDADISSWDLSKLQITQKGDFTRSFPLAVAAIWTSEANDIEVAASHLNVKFIQDGQDLNAAAGDEPSGQQDFVAQNREKTPNARSMNSGSSVQVPLSDVFIEESLVDPLDTTGIDGPRGPSVTHENSTSEIKAAAVQRSMQSPLQSQVDPLVERARGLIRLGDISGARLLLERAQARNARNATFLLAQTWDPAMLRRWNVRGLRADPDLARRLYARAAGQNQTDERLLAAAGR